MNKSQNIPKLRFPEFSGDWEKKKLGDLTTKMQSGLSRKLSASDIGLPVIRSNNIVGQNIDISDISYWYKNDPQGAITSNYFLRNGDLLVNFINSKSQIGKYAVYKGQLGRKAIFTTNIMRLQFNGASTSQFVACAFSSRKYQSFIHAITKPAVNQASFTTVDFKKFVITIPDKEEQQKITDFLTTVDERVEKLEKKVELLEQYKKGAMQVIFSQEIRFKDENGEGYQGWEEKELRETGTIITGKTPSTANKNLWGGDVLFVTPTDITEGVKYQNLAERTINSDGVKILPEGSIMYTCIASIGKMSLSVKPSVTNQQINSLIPNSDNDSEFIYYALLWLTPKIISTKSNNTVPIINKTEFSKFSLPIPSLIEQQKIADFLKAVDDKIELTNKELQQAKEFKKGLLQKMFV